MKGVFMQGGGILSWLAPGLARYRVGWVLGQCLDVTRARREGLGRPTSGRGGCRHYLCSVMGAMSVCYVFAAPLSLSSFDLGGGVTWSNA
jgi:hypothetical protein